MSALSALGPAAWSDCLYNKSLHILQLRYAKSATPKVESSELHVALWFAVFRYKPQRFMMFSYICASYKFLTVLCCAPTAVSVLLTLRMTLFCAVKCCK